MIRAPIARRTAREGDPLPQMLLLPWPPSVNRYWRTVSRVKQGRRWVQLEQPRTLISAEGRAYRDDAVRRIVVSRLRAYEIGEEVIARLHWHLPDRRRRDLDNIEKAVFDALQAGGVVRDDNQIRRFWSVFIQPQPDIGGHVRIDLARLL